MKPPPSLPFPPKKRVNLEQRKHQNKTSRQKGNTSLLRSRSSRYLDTAWVLGSSRSLHVNVEGKDALGMGRLCVFSMTLHKQSGKEY